MTAFGTKLGWMLLAGIVCLVPASRALAAANPATCVNDIDCVATPECGGDVCDYSAAGMTCKAAGSKAKGSDGWCTVDTDCKCKAQGAKCNGLYCTFTKASDAPATGTGGAGGSTTADGGTKPASSDSGGCSLAGSAPIGSAAGIGLALALLARGARRRRR
jgi:hypothetical protein